MFIKLAHAIVAKYRLHQDVKARTENFECWMRTDTGDVSHGKVKAIKEPGGYLVDMEYFRWGHATQKSQRLMTEAQYLALKREYA